MKHFGYSDQILCAGSVPSSYKYIYERCFIVGKIVITETAR
jgi:hypothetical protein